MEKYVKHSHRISTNIKIIAYSLTSVQGRKYGEILFKFCMNDLTVDVLKCASAFFLFSPPKEALFPISKQWPWEKHPNVSLCTVKPQHGESLIMRLRVVPTEARSLVPCTGERAMGRKISLVRGKNFRGEEKWRNYLHGNFGTSTKETTESLQQRKQRD